MSERRRALYALLVAAVLLLGVLGYAGYGLYPRFDLPAVTGAGLLVLAAAAGVASFFSPCSFPLLATLLARHSGQQDGVSPVLSRLLRYATGLSVGVALFLLLAGAGIALGAAPLFRQVTFTSTAGRAIRAAAGILLILLGWLQVRGLSPGSGAVYRAVKPLVEAQARLRRERPTVAFGLFGFSYVLAGFG